MLISGTASDAVQISNKGTAPFTVTGVAPPLPPGFALGALPGALNPGASTPLVVTFTGPTAPPSPNGITVGDWARQYHPSRHHGRPGVGHNRQLSVFATTQALEVILLLDASGSMAWIRR